MGGREAGFHPPHRCPDQKAPCAVLTEPLRWEVTHSSGGELQMGSPHRLPLALLPIGEEEGTRPGWANGSHPSSLPRTLGPVVQTPFPGFGTKGPSPAPLHTPSCVLQSAQGNSSLLGTPCHPHPFSAPVCTSRGTAVVGIMPCSRPQ